MYFISNKNLKETIFYPRISINYFIENGFKDNKQKGCSYYKSMFNWFIY